MFFFLVETIEFQKWVEHDEIKHEKLRIVEPVSNLAGITQTTKMCDTLVTVHTVAVFFKPHCVIITFLQIYSYYSI